MILETRLKVAVREAIGECNSWTKMDKMTWIEVEDIVKSKIHDALHEIPEVEDD